jgi:hypothetical protein
MLKKIYETILALSCLPMIAKDVCKFALDLIYVGNPKKECSIQNIFDIFSAKLLQSRF